MSIFDFYNFLESDYEKVKSRVMSDEILKKYVIKFKDDQSFPLLESAIFKKDRKNAFIYAHTIKGLYLTLGFDKYFKNINNLTELLREKENKVYNFDEINNLFDLCKKDYNTIISAIKEIN